MNIINVLFFFCSHFHYTDNTYFPKFAGKNSRNVSFKNNSRKLINCVNESGIRGPSGLIDASTTINNLHCLILSGNCNI